jgi:cyclic pyranopterin phosphate synthase
MSMPADPRPHNVIPIQSDVVPVRNLAVRVASGATKPMPAVALVDHGTGHTLLDQHARPLSDLRISVTDRCNFRCGYCMPRAAFGRDHVFLPHDALLSFEEISRAVAAALRLGVRKLRLTGGEPLMRRDLEHLIAQLSSLRTLDGTPPELALTTNGALLARKAQALKDAGLQRLTVSLDAINPAMFQRMSDSQTDVGEVLASIEAAQRAGLTPLKVNMVVQKGVNEGEILPMARHFRGTGIELRFIEFMDVGHTNHWHMAHVLPSDEVRTRIHAEHPLLQTGMQRESDTAERWAYADGAGHVGFISSVTRAFCGNCTRLRLSTDGQLYTCLFATQGHDLRTLLRDGITDEQTLAGHMAALWQQRTDRYSEQRGQAMDTIQAGGQRVEMSYIGG